MTTSENIVETIQLQLRGKEAAQQASVLIHEVEAALRATDKASVARATASVTALAAASRRASAATAALAAVEREKAMRAKLDSFDPTRERRMAAMTKELADKRAAALSQQTQTKGVAAGWNEHAGALGTAATALRGAGAFLQGAAAGFIAGAKVLAGTSAALVAAAAGMALITKEAVLDPMAKRQGMESAAGRLLGSPEKGAAAVRESMLVASELGLNLMDTAEQSTALLGRGFKMEGATGALAVIRGMADLKTISPSVRTENLITAIAQVRSKGKLQMEELQGQIGEAFDVGAVLEQIGKKLGKTQDEVRKMISAGKIDADTGIAGVLDAIRQKTGSELGGAAKEASMGLGGLMQRIKDFPSTVQALMQVDTSGVEKTLRRVWDAIDPAGDSGKALIGSLSHLGQAFVGIFADVGNTDIQGFVENVTRFIERAAAKLKEWTPAIRAAFGGFAEGFGRGLNALGDFFGDDSKRSSAKAWAEILGTIGSALGLIAGMAVSVASGVSTIGEFLSAAWTGLKEGAREAGGYIVDGLVEGIAGAASRAAKAAASLGSSTLAALKGAAGINSPSTIALAYGGFVGEGWVIGMDRWADRAEGVASQLATSSFAGLGGARPFTVPQLGGGLGGNTQTISVDYAPSITLPGADPANIKELTEQATKVAFDTFRVQMDRYLEEIGMEGGP